MIEKWIVTRNVAGASWRHLRAITFLFFFVQFGCAVRGWEVVGGGIFQFSDFSDFSCSVVCCFNDFFI